MARVRGVCARGVGGTRGGLVGRKARERERGVLSGGLEGLSGGM